MVPGGAGRFGFIWRGMWRCKVLGFVAAFVLVFSDFDLSSLLGTRSWTVWLFDAHQVGGLNLGESLSMGLVPAVCQGMILLLGLGVLLFGKDRVGEDRFEHLLKLRRCDALAWSVLVGCVVLVWVVPLFILLPQMINGLPAVLDGFAMMDELVTGMWYALVVAVVVMMLSGWCLDRGGRTVSMLLSLPGLLGPLVLGLLVLGCFQIPGLRMFYDTPIPLLMSLVLVCFPLGLQLRYAAGVIRPEESLHLASMLG